MKQQFIKRKITVYDLPLILVNCIPVAGVWLFHWEPAGIFIVYALETVLAGLFTILKMATAITVQKQTNPAASVPAGLFLILFFIIHYGFFVAIQMGMFLNMSNLNRTGDAGLFSFFRQIPLLMNEKVTWTMAAFGIIYTYNFFRFFIFSGEFKKASAGFLMFQPYFRILVQQVTVIAGGMFITLGDGKIFILIFILVKLFIELRIDYDAMLRKAPAPGLSQSGEQ